MKTAHRIFGEMASVGLYRCSKEAHANLRSLRYCFSNLSPVSLQIAMWLGKAPRGSSLGSITTEADETAQQSKSLAAKPDNLS